jgi:hypothetical protein
LATVDIDEIKKMITEQVPDAFEKKIKAAKKIAKKK